MKRRGGGARHDQASIWGASKDLDGAIYLACITLTNLNEGVLLTILFIAGISFPLIFYHHAWSLWLAMDHLIEGLSRQPGKL